MSNRYRRNPRRTNKKLLLPWFITLVLFLGISIGSAYLMRYSLLRWNIAELDNVQIIGANYINDNKLKFQVETYLGKNIFAIKDSSINQIALEFPGINKIRIIRQFPAQLIIHVTECTPIAYVETIDGKYFLIDDKGKVLEEKSDTSEYTFPKFTELGLENLTPGTIIDKNPLKKIIEVYKIVKQMYPDLLKNLEKFYYADEGVILTENKRGIRFIVGKDKFPSRVDKLDFAYTNFSINAFSEIDLRFFDIKNDLIILR